MTLKAASNKVDEHTRKMEAIHIEFEEGGSTSKAVNDVKSTEARHAQIMLPRSAVASG